MNLEWERHWLQLLGKTTQVRGMTIHRFRDGKIVLERSLWDTAGLMRQLGLAAPAALEFK